MRRACLVIFLSSALVISSARAEEDTALQQHVVEILTQDKKLIGTGTVVSFTGLILTAKHILYDNGEGGAAAPNYLTTVQVQFKDSMSLEQAELIAVHPYLDAAILKLHGASQTPLPAKLDTNFCAAKVEKDVITSATSKRPVN
jgi:hypothetical protein